MFVLFLILEHPDQNCMHTRFLEEWSNSSLESTTSDNKLPLVCQLINTSRTKKYSVVQHSNGFFVHVSEEHHGTLIECQSGFCKWQKEKLKKECIHFDLVKNVLLTNEVSNSHEESQDKVCFHNICFPMINPFISEMVSRSLGLPNFLYSNTGAARFYF